ncbi:MAG: tetratricopeptide repeat protein [Bacteroidota bacterium]|nr:tetratricopeptide repeat protein [Bacteroidota bacterium]
MFNPKYFTLSLLLVCLFVLQGYSYSSIVSVKDTNSTKGFNSVTNQIKLKQARASFLTEDYKVALETYREIFSSFPNEAIINFRLGECYFALKNYDATIEFLENARTQDPQVNKSLNLILGQAYQRNGKLDKTIEVLQEYLNNPKSSKEENSQALIFIEQCKTAKALMANPVNVKINNPGPDINSVYEDYAPSLTADGKTLIFTSRRPETTGGKVDIDGKYFEDIYISTYNDSTNKWSVAESVEGRLNTEFHDAALSISADGKQIFVYKNIPGETGSGDIYVSKLNNKEKWGAPKPMPKEINTSYFESSASLSADEQYFYFVSERRGGYGNGDIYRCKKISKREWGEAENLGPVINSSEDEVSVFIHPDGKTLFFSSKGHNTMGGYDIFKSVNTNGVWSKPENIGFPINTLQDDLHFVLSLDNSTAYYSSTKKGTLGERDIFQIDMKSYAVHLKDGEVYKSNGLSILKGSVYNTDAAQVVEANIRILDLQEKEITSIDTNTEGEYFVTLPGGVDYQMVISTEGFETIKEKINLPLDETKTFILVKHFLIEKLVRAPDFIKD